MQEWYSLLFTLSHKNLNEDVYSSSIYYCQNLEATNMSFTGEWINTL
jgi:hypothetical protein